MKLKTEEDVEANASIYDSEIDRPITPAYVKQEPEDSKESFKRALYSPVKMEPTSSRENNCERNLPIGIKKRHCDICNITFPTQDLYFRHDLHWHETEKTPIIDFNTFTCNICNLKFSLLKPYRHHMDELNNVHIPFIQQIPSHVTQEMNYCCRTCSATLESSKAYYKHLLDAHNIPVINPPVFRERQVTPGNTKPTFNIVNMYCDVCNKTYLTKKTYIRHVVLIHGITLPDAYLQLDNFDQKAKYCKVCDAKYKINLYFKAHLKRVHNVTLPNHFDLKPNVYDQNNHCVACNQTFLGKRYFIEHLTANHFDQVPELCEGVDCKDQNIKGSKRTRYCADCKKVFLSKFLYRVHLDKFHGIKLLNGLPKGVDREINKFKNHCTFCDKVYNGRGLYISHMLHVHNINIRKYSSSISDSAPALDSLEKYCDICDRSYQTVVGYREHLSKHHQVIFGLTKSSLRYVNRNKVPEIDGTGTYCTACERLYGTRRAFKLHLTRVHSIKLSIEQRERKTNVIFEADDKNNHCISCDKTFTSRYAYTLHLGRIHGKWIYKKTKP